MFTCYVYTYIQDINHTILDIIYNLKKKYIFYLLIFGKKYKFSHQKSNKHNFCISRVYYTLFY